jgi:hypothetical protein
VVVCGPILYLLFGPNCEQYSVNCEQYSVDAIFIVVFVLSATFAVHWSRISFV